LTLRSHRSPIMFLMQVNSTTRRVAHTSQRV
jgi:hypothetical protein